MIEFEQVPFETLVLLYEVVSRCTILKKNGKAISFLPRSMNAGAGAVDAGFGCAAATAALRCEFPIITSYRVLSSDHTLREFRASVLLPGHPRQNKDGPCRYTTGGKRDDKQ